MLEARTCAVIIPAWNAVAFLPHAFSSLDAQAFHDFTVTVVDNGSNDGTARWVETERPEAVILRNFKNLGLARARNQGVALALTRWPEEEWGKKYILLMGVDVELAPACLGELVAAMEADPALAACGPKILQSLARHDEDEGRATDRTDAIHSAGIEMTRGRTPVFRGMDELDEGQYDLASQPFGLCGSCILFRASALVRSKVAGELYDEEFGAALIDEDMAWRMRRFGFAAKLVPSAIAWQQRTSVHASARQRSRNAKWLCWKNDELLNRLIHFPWIFPATVGRIGGMFAVWPRWLSMRRKAKEIARRATVSGGKMRRWFV